MAQRSNPTLSKPGLGRSLLRLPYYVGRGRSAFHQGQELRAPTKAVYIGADQIVVTLIFRLRHGGGPYIPNATDDLEGHTVCDSTRPVNAEDGYILPCSVGHKLGTPA